MIACLCGPRAAVAAAHAAMPAQQQRAQELYNEGAARFKAARHAEAAESFRKSYEVVASPSSPLMYARALREGKTQQTIANIGLAVGVIGVGTGVTLFVIDSKQSSGRRPRQLQSGAGPGSISVRGSF